MRFFNTAGPCDPERHYMIPAAPRLPDARRIIDQGGYFVVHAPRQTGKTTTLRTIAPELVTEGKYAALCFTCEVGEPLQEDIAAAQRTVLGAIRLQAMGSLPPELRPPDPWPEAEAGMLLWTALTAWAEACPRPLVLFFDEIDALRGESLRSVLRQLRAGYANRPSRFPWSIALCGLRDVRDYKAASGGDPGRMGTSSPFNVKVESERLANFDREQVCALYKQHTEETEQPFDDEAVRRAFEVSGGQPWLVNALAREITEKMRVAPPAPITVEHIEEAKERLILARATHLDSLVARLHEPRVRAVIAPVLEGTVHTADAYEDDFQYVRDLGLIAPDNPVRIANPIYREVIARVLAAPVERVVTDDPRSFLLPDGRLDMPRLLDQFAAFWREHGEVLERGLLYHEVAPQLVLMAYLQRIVNGGGYVDREYGVGRGRIDLCVRMPYTGPDGKRAWQREALELKVWAKGKPDPRAQGLLQLEGYLDRLGLARGVLVIFDRRPRAQPIHKRTRFQKARTPKRYPVTLLRA